MKEAGRKRAHTVGSHSQKVQEWAKLTCDVLSQKGVNCERIIRHSVTLHTYQRKEMVKACQGAEAEQDLEERRERGEQETLQTVLVAQFWGEFTGW